MTPRRRTWSTPFRQEFGRALTGLAIGFMVSFLLCMIPVHQGTAEVPRHVDARQVLDAISVCSMAMLCGCVVAAPIMASVMLLERKLRIDLGAAIWTCIGLVPTAALSVLLLGRLAADVPPTMWTGGFAAILAHLMRRTTGRRTETREYLGIAAAWACMLAASWLVAVS